MSEEKQPRKRRGQGESVANEQPPPLQLPKGQKRQRRARAPRSNVQRHSPPLARPRSSGRGGSPLGHNTRCTLRPLPPYSAHLKGGKKKRRKSQAVELPKKFSRGAWPPGQGEQSLKGEIVFVPCRFFS